jgi:hypothetical protein
MIPVSKQFQTGKLVKRTVGARIEIDAERNDASNFKNAAKKLTGYRKQDFMAKVAEDCFDGSASKTETVLE